MLHEALVTAAEGMGLQPLPVFIDKCIQLYETTVVRHGLMIVGPTGGGKTCCYRVLAAAMSSLRKTDAFEGVRYSVINPKAVTIDQLYGSFSDLTHEWTEGIIANIVRDGTVQSPFVCFFKLLEDGVKRVRATGV